MRKLISIYALVSAVSVIFAACVYPGFAEALSFSLGDFSGAGSAPSVSYYVPQSYLYAGSSAQASQSPITSVSRTLWTLPVSSGSFWSRLGTLFILDYLFRGNSGGILNPTGMDLGNIFILDQLFR